MMILCWQALFYTKCGMILGAPYILSYALGVPPPKNSHLWQMNSFGVGRYMFAIINILIILDCLTRRLDYR